MKRSCNYYHKILYLLAISCDLQNDRQPMNKQEKQDKFEKQDNALDTYFHK